AARPAGAMAQAGRYSCTRPQPVKGNPVDDTTPGAPVGPSSSSTLTGSDDVTVKVSRPPTWLEPSTVSSPGATVKVATVRAAPRVLTTTCAMFRPGLATARLLMAAEATPGACTTPGPGTSHRVDAETVPEDDPHC